MSPKHSVQEVCEAMVQLLFEKATLRYIRNDKELAELGGRRIVQQLYAAEIWQSITTEDLAEVITLLQSAYPPLNRPIGTLCDTLIRKSGKGQIWAKKFENVIRMLGEKG